jgi:hypothetical protein
MKSVEFSFEVVPIGAELHNRNNRSKVLPEFGISISNLQFLMATISPQKKNSSTRTWVIEGFDGSTCFFQQTLSATSLPDARIIPLLQRLLSRHLLAHRDMRPETAVGRFRGNADSRKLSARRIYEFTP